MVLIILLLILKISHKTLRHTPTEVNQRKKIKRIRMDLAIGRNQYRAKSRGLFSMTPIQKRTYSLDMFNIGVVRNFGICCA